MNNKLLSLLGLCRKAGRVAPGFEKVLEAAAKHHAALILIAADTAARTEKEVRYKTGDTLPVIRIRETQEEISKAIGTAVGILALTDEGFAKQAMLLIDEGGNAL